MPFVTNREMQKLHYVWKQSGELCYGKNYKKKKKKEQFMEAVAEERKQLSEKADRRYRHITSIIKRNPNAVSRVHKESINEIKEIIANRKAKRDR